MYYSVCYGSELILIIYAGIHKEKKRKWEIYFKKKVRKVAKEW